MIIIEHTHEEGTILSGSRTGDGVYEIVRQHGFTWRRSVGIHIQASRDKDARQRRIDAAAAALRAAGHEVEVKIDNTWRTAAEREADRAERADARADRYADRAHSAVGRATAAQEKVDAIADGIPFGQPILVGHHSQRRAERDQERMQTGMRTAIREREYAADLASRADGAARNEAAKHNPRAITSRIERLEADLRGWRRRVDDEDYNVAYRERADREIARLEEDIAHQRAKLAAMEASGEYVPWRREDFVKGDEVRVLGRWLPVRRVNAKSVSVPGAYGMAMTGNDATWSETVPYNEIGGRRRDGMQLDKPNGQPWPVEQAKRVARWRDLLHSAGLPSTRYDDGTRHVEWARRLVHGLSLDAADSQVAAFEQDVVGVEDRRRLAVAYLGVHDRLAAGERAADIAAGLAPFGAHPGWQLPAGEPVNRRVDQLVPGDLVKGFYDRGRGTELVRSFCGPVVEVSPVVDRHERGTRVTVTLQDGTRREFQTYVWLAVFPATGQDLP